ncbi:unnamed protein product [Cladocopium goreaui]|uniref:Uncharacterized protein n=1 Tax=Cladocopium goreaui TaxID=2562237 RepID=A0A9P1D8Z7_9DINO|nr:unnamed protein product [Cladocopium goreaui]
MFHSWRYLKYLWSLLARHLGRSRANEHRHWKLAEILVAWYGGMVSEQPCHSMATSVKLLTNVIFQSVRSCMLAAPVCLSQTACGVIYPGEEHLCCDRCAQVYIKFPDGIGIYEVQQCTSRTCDQATCTTMASWMPNISQTTENVSFRCVTEGGSDAIELVDNCDLITDQLSPSALCGHVGFVATSTIWTALGDTPVDCELSPSCPESVLDTTRPAQSCCFGTHWSLQLNAQGEDCGLEWPHEDSACSAVVIICVTYCPFLVHG